MNTSRKNFLCLTSNTCRFASWSLGRQRISSANLTASPRLSGDKKSSPNWTLDWEFYKESKQQSNVTNAISQRGIWNYLLKFSTHLNSVSNFLLNQPPLKIVSTNLSCFIKNKTGVCFSFPPRAVLHHEAHCTEACDINYELKTELLCSKVNFLLTFNNWAVQTSLKISLLH